jgi:Chalcone isomerase-like
MVSRRLPLQALTAFVVAGVGATVWRPARANNPPAATAGEALSGQRAIGQSLFRWWGLEVYRATLYGDASFDPPRFERQRFALELEYLRNFSGRDIAQRSLDEMQAIAPLDPAQARGWLDAMLKTFPDVRPGDRLLGVHEPERGARFYVNGRLLAAVDDPAFSARFFGIWLSPRTSQPRLRDALIAGASR